ncbi:anaphase-promoting complex subunit 6 [Cladophialophora psammophila CBS 110553]|uniref:Anaphase-promoting complex subunit 6 n=1 Tax=Cladophialophora psammophila CBS 110553 TaxID=1182543 RepID=W9WPR8_9EURO|nr:anaphase-promoting complex subunit 6 [Cladophialophora psammophila CBS 110553]EXJ69893.1 anaphase-promoting complex subunit 6 [Cladophialophora psammophila CBS 110553]
MDKYLRVWRQDALNKGQHDAAIYIGDKVLALTNNDADAFWLAQVHFGHNNFTRALALLLRKDLINRSLSCRYLAAHCYVKQGRYDQALAILGEENPTHLITASHNARRKLAHINGHSQRNITQRGGKAQRDRIEFSEERERDRESEKELKFQAGMCYLRGLCFAKRNAFDRARDCYKDAVRIDVQCFEAFDQLMKNSLMSPSEELAFLEELDFDSIRIEDQSLAQEAAHFTKLLYTTRLSKYSAPETLANAAETLSTHYNLASNPDLLLTRAETLYTQCRFHDALAITTSILNSQNSPDGSADASSSNTNASLGHSPRLYPLHLAVLHETGSHNTLFHLSHTLAAHAPHESYTYLAIGTYYLSTYRIPEARRFFSKASLMDPHSAAAWIGFAHTFAAEGEHDQAIAAYSTAARLFQGSHLPQLFLGMQHLALNNMRLAWEYCLAAFQMSSGTPNSGSEDDLANMIFNNTASLGGDPLVLNEIGVILYHQSNLPAAAKLFHKSLQLASELGCNMTAWIATRANLAHSLRRMGRFEEALAEFDECLRIATGGAAPSSAYEPGRGMTAFAHLSLAGTGTSLSPSGAVSGYDERNLIGSIHTSRGLVLLSIVGRTKEAVMALHEAVRVLGGDAGGGGVAGTLLSRALQFWSLEGSPALNGLAGALQQGSPEPTSKVGTRSKRRGNEAAASTTTTGQMSNEEKIEQRMDGHAAEILNAALGSVR